MNPNTYDASITSQSKSQSQGSASSGSRLSQSKDLRSRTLFILCDQITKTARTPSVFYVIAVLIIFLQMLATSCWVEANGALGGDGTVAKGVRMFLIIFMLAVEKLDENNILPIFIVHVCVAVIAFLYLAVIYGLCAKKRRIPNMALVPFRWWIEFIALIDLNPMAYLVGVMIERIGDGDHSVFMIVGAIVSAIATIAMMAFVYFFMNVMSHAIYMSKSPFTTFDNGPVLIMLILSPIMAGCTHVFSMFPSWTIYLLSMLHMLTMTWNLFKLSRIPFLSSISNVMCIAASIACGILDICAFIGLADSGVPEYIYAVLIPVSAVVGLVAGVSWVTMVRRKIKRDLAFNKKKNEYELFDSDDEDIERCILEDQEKVDWFRDLGLNQSEERGLMYLYHGLEFMSDMLLDLSLIKFLAHTFTSNTVSVHLIKVVVLFPGEYRLLNQLIVNGGLNRGMGITGDFVMFQITKIKILRQSSASAWASEKTKEMVQVNQQLIDMVKSFWLMPTPDINALPEISDSLSKGEAQWNESIVDYPNSTIIRDEYSAFLCEVATDFERAIKQRYCSQLIDSGRNFSVDHCFRSFIGHYPLYIKKKVLSLKGDRIRQQKRGKGSSASGGNCGTDSSLSTTIDARLEEDIGKTIITQAKMRLALQCVTDDRRANNSQSMLIVILYVLILCLGSTVAMYIVFNSYFTERYTSVDKMRTICYVRLGLGMANMFLVLTWGERFPGQRTSLDPRINDYWQTEDITSSSLHEGNTYEQEMIWYNVYARSSYNSLMEEIADLSTQGIDVYTLTEIMFYEKLENAVCNDDRVLMKHFITFQTAVTALFIQQSTIVSSAPVTDWWNASTMFCELTSNMASILTGTETVLKHFLDDEQDKSDASDQMLMICTIAVPVAIFLLTIIPFLTVVIRFVHEMNQLLKMMFSVDSAHRNETQQSIRKNANDNDENRNNQGQMESSRQLYAHVVGFCILIGVLLAGIAGILAGLGVASIDMNTQFRYLSYWVFYNGLQSSSVAVVLTLYYRAILLSGYAPMATNITDYETQIMRLREYLSLLNDCRDNMMTSSDGIRSIVGYDSNVDFILIEENCVPNTESVDAHELYRCGGVNQMMAFFQSQMEDGILNMDTTNSSFAASTPSEMYHLALGHLVPQVRLVTSRIGTMMTSFINDFKEEIIILFVCGLVISAVVTICAFLAKRYLDRMYATTMILIRRLSPVGIVANNELISYILNREAQKETSQMSTTKAVIQNTSDAIICLNLIGTVESVNKAATFTLGYTPDQMLGQDVITFLANDEQEKIKQQMALMTQKQSGPMYEDHTTFVSDNEQIVPCYITIMGMLTKNDDIESFVFIVRDETEHVKQQKAAELAKNKSEELLYQILPRDIVVRINAGEKDISFVVPSASISFIDIVKFSEYAANLTPSEIMGNLSLMFAAFDEVLTKYPLIIKIKLIGDVYMSAAGLFNPDEAPQSHAQQMVGFGLDALSKVEETSVKLDAMLNVRIGVNSGGPLIAGVLGTDKPVFDIIGDPINIASRLQSTDIPGRIQIPQSTYDLVCDIEEFSIETRGEVFLKGKGKTTAYLVRPRANELQFSLSDQRPSSLVGSSVRP